MSSTPIAGHYTQAEIDQAATLMTQGMPGLGLDAARKWVTSEQGQNNNVLGVTYTDAAGHQQLYAYPTLAAGVAAAIANWNRAPYAAARKALAAATTTAQQLTAIASSPWNHAYYSKVLTTAPLGPPQGGLGKAGVASAAKVTMPPVALASATSATGATVAAYLGIPASTPFTAFTAAQAARKYSDKNGVRAYLDIYTRLMVWVPKHVTAGEVPFNVDPSGGNTNQLVTPSPAQQAAGDTTRGSLLPDIGSMLVNGAVLAAVLVLGYRGIRELLP